MFAPLPRLAVDGQQHVVPGRVAELVRGHHPWAEHRIGVERLAERSLLRPADGDVQADRIARDERQRVLARDVAAPPADHHRQFDLMVGAAIRQPELDPLPGTDQRAGGLQEQPGLLDAPDVRAAERRLVGDHFVEVRGVVHWRGDQLARIGHRAQQPDLGELAALPAALVGDRRSHRIEMGDEQVVVGQRIPRRRQAGECRRDIDQPVPLDQPEPIVVISAKSHGLLAVRRLALVAPEAEMSLQDLIGEAEQDQVRVRLDPVPGPRRAR